MGLGLIILGIAITNEKSAFPGFFAVFPSFGAGLLISAGPNAWLNLKVFSSRIPVWIGLISYPLYLWHWPILVLLSKNLSTSRTQRLEAVLLSLLLSVLTYLFLEKPLRIFQQRKRVTGLVTCSIIIGFFGVQDYVDKGFPNRFPKKIDLISKSYDTKELYRFKECFLDAKEQTPAMFSVTCNPSEPQHSPSILLWGDSHAAHLFHGLDESIDKKRYRLWQYTATSCPPLLGGEVTDNGHCKEIIDFVKNQIKKDPPEIVILGSRWDRDSANLERKITETAAYLFSSSVKQILLFGPPPAWYPTVRDLSVKAYRQTGVLPERMTQDPEAFSSLEHEDEELRTISEKNRIIYISSKEILCAKNSCLTSFSEGDLTELVSSDYDHFTSMASIYVIKHALPQNLLAK